MNELVLELRLLPTPPALVLVSTCSVIPPLLFAVRETTPVELKAVLDSAGSESEELEDLKLNATAIPAPKSKTQMTRMRRPLRRRWLGGGEEMRPSVSD